MQIGEQHLAFLEHGPFLGLRLLDLDDHLSAVEDLRGGADDLRPGGLIVGVLRADPDTRVGFDDDIVAVVNYFLDALRREPNPVLVDFYFFGNAYQHDSTSAQ